MKKFVAVFGVAALIALAMVAWGEESVRGAKGEVGRPRAGLRKTEREQEQRAKGQNVDNLFRIVIAAQRARGDERLQQAIDKAIADRRAMLQAELAPFRGAQQVGSGGPW